MADSYFADPFAFGFDASADELACASNAGAIATSAVINERRRWLVKTYGADSVEVDVDYILMLQELEKSYSSEVFAEYITTRGSARHYPLKTPKNVSIALSTIASIVHSQKGIIHRPPARRGDADPQERINITCHRGHHCELLPQDIDSWCTLCKCIDALSACAPGRYEPCTNTFGSEAQYFRIRCPQSHEFIITLREAPRGCPSCRIERTVVATSFRTIKVISPYENNRAPLRMQCLTCKMQFYSTAEDIAGACSCEDHHICSDGGADRAGTIRRLLELLYRARFDDNMMDEDVSFDALSIKYGIAAIVDSPPARFARAQDWCSRAQVRLIVISKKETDCELDILVQILMGMVATNIITEADKESLRYLAKYLLSISESLRKQRRPLADS